MRTQKQSDIVIEEVIRQGDFSSARVWICAMGPMLLQVMN